MILDNPKWKETGVDDAGEPVEREVSLAQLLWASMQLDKTSTGFDAFKRTKRVFDALTVADKNIDLDGEDYGFLVGIVKKNIPAAWGGNVAASDAVLAFVAGKTGGK
jgi:hypothetical protein